MAIRDINELYKGKVKIDLIGPQGNAYALLGLVAQYGKQLGWDQQKIEEVRKDMKSSDYEHLVKTFDNHFGDYVDLYR